MTAGLAWFAWPDFGVLYFSVVALIFGSSWLIVGVIAPRLYKGPRAKMGHDRTLLGFRFAFYFMCAGEISALSSWLALVVVAARNSFENSVAELTVAQELAAATLVAGFVTFIAYGRWLNRAADVLETERPVRAWLGVFEPSTFFDYILWLVAAVLAVGFAISPGISAASLFGALQLLVLTVLSAGVTAVVAGMLAVAARGDST